MARTIELNLVYTLLLSVLVYFVGQTLASQVALLKCFSIPPPVVGGCLVAVALALADGFLHTRVAFTMTLKTDHFYQAGGRFVMDVQGLFWKL